LFIIPALRRLRQQELKFKVSMEHRNTLSQRQKNTKKKVVFTFNFSLQPSVLQRLLARPGWSASLSCHPGAITE
jgi:hypothetical protein